MARFLCAGDLHLEAGPDLGRTPGDRLREQEEVWRRVLEIAEEEDVDAILFAGDAFHKARPTPEAMLAFERPLLEHRRFEGWPVYATLGNHDRSGVAAGTGLHVFAEADIIRLASEPTVWRVPVGVDEDVSVCALPWTPTAHVIAAQNGGDRDAVNDQAAELLVGVARGLRAQVDGPAILLTHFSVSGSALPNGLPVDQLREPVLDLADLEALGFDAVILGHIHKPQALSPLDSHVLFPDEEQATVGGARIFYVGSPLPLNFGEAGTAHGVWVIATDPWSSRFIPIESRPLVNLEFPDVDAAELDVAEMDRIGSDFGGAIVKVRIHATPEDARRFDVAAYKRRLEAYGAEKVYSVQVEVEKPERARVTGLTEELGEMEALDLWLESAKVNGSKADTLRERTRGYLERARS